MKMTLALAFLNISESMAGMNYGLLKDEVWLKKTKTRNDHTTTSND